LFRRGHCIKIEAELEELHGDLAKGSQPMHKPGSFHILLVHPPVESPAAPPLATARAAALLAGSGLSFEQYDANLDFFLNHVLTPQRLTGFVDLIKKRGKQGIVNDADHFFITLFANLDTNSEQWARKIAGVGHSLELLRTEDFYRPEFCLTALKDIGDLLDLASLAYYPSRIQWGHFSNPEVQNVSQTHSFVEDYETNPFLPFCQDGVASRIVRVRLGLIILFVSAPDQVLAALTIARFCKKQYPRLHVALLSNYGLLAGTGDYSDSLLPENDPQLLCDLITSLTESTIVGDSAGPDFSGLPLKDYLAPAVVLPFEELSGFKENVTPPSRLMAHLVKQEQRCGAKGFLSKDAHLTPAYIAKMAGKMAEERPSFCIGLKCALNASTGTEKMAAAYEAGVRLIQWRDPTGELTSLTTHLWDVSRADIWNHVVIAAEQESSLAQGLIDFIAANPNIVHSWIQQQPCISAFGCPAEQTERSSAAYIQVATLPGQPLWRRLNEPVYQLLYLDRHGVKKVMRWRVRDDGYSVYSLGQNITYHFVTPQELPPGYLDEICRMVEAGGSVGTKWVRYNLERAFLIGYVMEEGMIVGNSSLKYPRSEYVEAVNKQSGLDLTDYLERGYTSVRPEYRGMGIGTTLLEGLTARVGKKKVFSIISSDNIATQKIALRNKTKQVATFYSERLGKEIGVWIPAWMIED
jgi:GNAT superfamily N-acetyltransferase